MLINSKGVHTQLGMQLNADDTNDINGYNRIENPFPTKGEP